MIVCQNNQEVTYQGRVLALPRPVSPAKDEEGLPQPAFSPRSVLGGHGHGAETPPPSAAPATAGAGAPPPHRKDSCGSFAVPPICSLDDVIASADVILFNDDAFANINMNMNLVEDPPAPHNYYHETSAAAAACGSPYMLPDNAGGGLYPAQMQQQQQSPAALYSEYNNAATESGDTVVPQIMEGLVVRKGSEGSELLAALRRGAPPPPAKRRRKKQQQRQRALSPTPNTNGTSGGGKISGKVSPVLSSTTTQRKSGGCKKAGGGSRRRSSFPKATTAVLKGWLRTHFLNPYPSDLDKKQLCSECDLTMSQLQTWFINARIRIWKPCVESLWRESKKSGGCGGHGHAKAANLAAGSVGPGGETMTMIQVMRRANPNLEADIEQQVETFMSAVMK